MMSLGAGIGGGRVDDEDLLPPDVFVPGRHKDDAKQKIDKSVRALESMRGI